MTQQNIFFPFLFFLSRVIKWTPTSRFKYLLTWPFSASTQGRSEECGRSSMPGQGFVPFIVFLNSCFSIYPFFHLASHELLQTKSRASCVCAFSRLTDNLESSLQYHYSFSAPFFIFFCSPAAWLFSQQVTAINSEQQNIILKALCSFSRLRGPRQRRTQHLELHNTSDQNFVSSHFNGFILLFEEFLEEGGQFMQWKMLMLQNKSRSGMKMLVRDRRVHPSRISCLKHTRTKVSERKSMR